MFKTTEKPNEFTTPMMNANQICKELIYEVAKQKMEMLKRKFDITLPFSLNPYNSGFEFYIESPEISEYAGNYELYIEIYKFTSNTRVALQPDTSFKDGSYIAIYNKELGIKACYTTKELREALNL